MKRNHKIGIFTLAMINVAAIASLKNLPMMAEYGLSLVFFYSLAAIVFFIPSALVSAELATGWPKRGGVYIWVKEAFGPRWGFVAIWLQWIENVIWYPTILSFTAGTIAYIISPELASNKIYTILVVLITFWGASSINMLGMKASGFISTIGVIAGTIIPGLFIIVLGIIWVSTGKDLQIEFSAAKFFPDLTDMDNLVFLTGVLLGLMGMEMSAVHAQEVDNPQKNYPKAILLSALIILVVMILGSLSIAIVVPHSKIALVSGVMQAFDYFFIAYNLHWLTPILAALIAIGAVGMVSTWIVGPTKGLLATGQAGDLPPFFQKMNKNNMPVHVMILQGVIVTLMALAFLIMPTVGIAYLVLTALTSQLYLVMYILMFISAIKLRYSQPNVHRTYRVHGGNVGMWIVAGIGVIASIFTIIFGFLPSSLLKGTEQIVVYEIFMFSGIIVMLIVPTIIHHYRKDSWKHNIKIED